MGRPAEWACVLAVRAALRVLPLVSDPMQFPDKKPNSILTMMAFRAVALSSGAAKILPDDKVAAVASAAAKATTAAYAAAVGSNVVVVAAATAATDAATAIADAATAADAAGYAVNSAAAASSRATAGEDASAGIWREFSLDCTALGEGLPPGQLLERPLWHEQPDWFNQSWGRAEEWLEWNYALFWRNWYDARLRGTPHALPWFDADTDLRFHRFLFEKDDDWWKRDLPEVNREIADWVNAQDRGSEPPIDYQLVQNPQVLTFSTDEEGRTVVDPEVAPNGLQDDPDARDNHAEITRLIRCCLASTLDAPTQQKAIAGPVELLREAMGTSVAETRPRSFVLRAREVIRQVKELESDQSMGVPLSDEQRKAFLPLVAALNMLADFDPKLAILWAGKIDGDANVLSRWQLDRLVDALRESGQTDQPTLEVLETTVEQVSPNVAETDPARRTASETLRNVFRSMGKTVKQLDGALKTGERVFKLMERGAQIWVRAKDYLPDDDTIAQILKWLGMGGE